MNALVENFKSDRRGSCPTNAIGDYFLNVLVVERAARLVTGLEVEYLSCAAEEASTRTEDKSVLIPCTENESIGLGNVEGLTVKLLRLDRKVIGNSRANRMLRHEIPYYLFLVSTPGKISVCSDYCLEGLGMMSGVKCDKAHFSEINSFADLLDKRV